VCVCVIVDRRTRNLLRRRPDSLICRARAVAADKTAGRRTPVAIACGLPRYCINAHPPDTITNVFRTDRVEEL